ncbi:iron-responsive element-binding protein 2 isoform X1 [Aptenodytes patagonicus]|uniref:iron-responsive element-binding protein 2 isoform X1 n=1 Tax=Aptenodytes patagonicus TaxID=9234 RepID=UPI003FA0D13E
MDPVRPGSPYQPIIEALGNYPQKKFYNVSKLGGAKYDTLPYSIRVLFESSIRNCDGFLVKETDAMNILDWKTKQNNVEVPFCPARVVLQDFTGIPAMVDFAAMREAVRNAGGDPMKVNPACPTDLTVDHSLQIDFSKCAIQNAPNPGGGDSQKPMAKLSPLKAQPRKLPCRGQTGCKGPCSAGDSSRNSGQFSAQIENTPILCPFHLQPVPEPETVLKNQELEFGRNRERLQFFKWSSKVFKNISIIPPETGMAHQVNLEYVSRVVFEVKDFLYPDSVVGTDSHTTMVNGLGILGWGPCLSYAEGSRAGRRTPGGVSPEQSRAADSPPSTCWPRCFGCSPGYDWHKCCLYMQYKICVGGIETEAVMLGMPVTLTLPEVVGCELTGTASPLATSIDIVLSITKHLRQADVAGKFVEFFGSGVSQLSVADRTTIANMCPEYGAILSFFPVDNVTLKHLKHTGFDKAKLEVMEVYLKAVKLFRNDESSSREPEYSQVVQISLSSIIPYVSGPKRSQDRVAVNNMKSDFQACLNEKSGVKGFQIAVEKQNDIVPVQYEGNEYKLSHGCIVIAAVISCTNNCNPSVMLAAGLLAKKAVEAGLVVKPYIRTSLSPGSGMVTHYLSSSGVLPYLSKLGFEVVGYGCSTCVGNTAPLPEAIRNAIKQGDIIACGVLSGTKNFEGRICDCVRANYLASPPLVVAYAIAGTVRIDFETEPLGTGFNGKSIYLRDIWPTRRELHTVEEECVISSMFKELKEKMEKGNKRWNLLEAPESTLFPWDLKSTYIRCPSFFDKLAKEPVSPQPIENAHVLLYLGDSVTTDHISPAGSIARSSAAAKYLTNKGLTPREFNSYGARRGNDAVMTRGTFANIKLLNKFIGKPAPKTIHFPSGQTLDVFEAAELYQKEGIPVIILAGRKYGLGSSRDWAAKGPFLLGVKAVLAESYEKVHKSQLIGIGIAPLQFLPGENPSILGLTGREQFSILFPPELSPGMTLDIKTSTGKVFSVMALFENDMEITLYKYGGSLNFVARRFL